MRNTAEASGRATEDVFGRDPDDKVGALARMVLDHREGLGLSQREFAKESVISRTILSKVEQGELYPGGKVRRKPNGSGEHREWHTSSESVRSH